VGHLKFRRRTGSGKRRTSVRHNRVRYENLADYVLSQKRCAEGERNVSDRWAQISNEIPWTVVAAIMGAFLGGVINFVVAKRESKANRALDFHKEFHGAEMASARAKAWKFALDNPSLKFKDIRYDTDDYTKGLWAVMRFFQRLSVCVNRGFLDIEITIDLFGEVFIWWYEITFKESLKDSGLDAEIAISQLHAAIKTGAGESRTSRWERAAANSRSEYLKLIAAQRTDNAPVTPPDHNS
jgi:hypothetical protein